MRILHVTDFHFRKPWFHWLSVEVQKYDVCCFTGDFIDSFPNAAVGLHQQARWILDWLREFPKPLFACTGNHDYWPEQGSARDADANGGWLLKAARPGLAVDGSFTQLGTVNFMSLPWAFESRVAITIATPTILLSHAAPLGTFIGLCLDGDMGDPELADVVEKLPQGSLVLSGHVHEPKRWHDRIGSVWCFNPGVDSNAETPNYVAIDTTAGLAIRYGWGHESDPLRLNWPQSHTV